ncbi:MAG: RNA-splicing ligase RtcB [Omnitrophica WOR_2 bacterium GWF2_38_59]|nr:MAG: RNA-splicing ligase RtcB [Omnitrophica WOR_2 bacterium GWF2_38_59]OGX50174.1 MAG: RNA-splicing ligase RtcB [Omnitrophica WOR_2 bacterium RIFOXYA2_FULL_38_17]OGX57488.1 MAG: RNA-splicing ligase RtcB [Omnitrophica WOR_2 bacterium RIFOXYC2_FULL_38_12]OGX59195.1 MAG: RNA-splicing ligase RtcB [Omnitrophica WOR_2 bacterium RIFOXYB2_FULL_38_16]HBG60483.1 RNA-splicing ligase RtcB [Candidatus Omnitrophota bacterium]
MVKRINNIPVWGDPIEGALNQMINCSKDAEYCALMADHHPGYALPIGGVIAYRNKVSPSGVGYDIACGNKAIRLDLPAKVAKNDIKKIMKEIVDSISFGVGMKNKETIDHAVFHDDPGWNVPAVKQLKLKKLAQEQLGTVGSGNHYVDVFIDEGNRVWVGVHFGSRGLGHRIATYFIKAGGGKDGMNVDPVLLDVSSTIGQDYIACMKLAGRYAYAGRDWVCNRIARLLKSSILEEVHNHHNYAWQEEHKGNKFWVIRKGATPAFPGQKGFVGGSMGDISVIIEGVESAESKESLYSTVHGAGRVMSRTQAAGRYQKRKRVGGQISRQMMDKWLKEKNVTLLGAGTDESPHCYKRLPEVLDCHDKTIKILHTLTPIGVAMASSDEFDPYKH